MSYPDGSRRITEFMLRYWLRARSGQAFPREEMIVPSDLGEFWDNCYLVALTDDSEYGGYKFEYAGPVLIDAFANQLTDEYGEIYLSPATQRIMRRFDEVVANRRPVVDEGEFENAFGHIIKYRQTMLPIATNDSSSIEGWEIGYILGGMRWKTC